MLLSSRQAGQLLTACMAAFLDHRSDCRLVSGQNAPFLGSVKTTERHSYECSIRPDRKCSQDAALADICTMPVLCKGGPVLSAHLARLIRCSADGVESPLQTQAFDRS